MPSSYYTDDRSHDRRSDRDHRDYDDRKRNSRRHSPEYEEEEIIQARRGPKAGRNDRGAGPLIPRPRDDDDSDYGDRRRDYGNPPRRSKSARDTKKSKYDYSSDSSESPPRRRRDDRRRRRDDSYSTSRSPPRRERRKSLGEQALAALGIGGAAAAAAAGGRSKSHDRGDRDRRRRHRDSSSDSSGRSRSRAGGKGGALDSKEKIQAAVKAALAAGAAEAFRMRKEPGGWSGEKGKRVLTAAVGAGGINGLLDKDGTSHGGTRHTIESVIGGLAGNRLLNGSRDDAADRSRSRSRGRGDDKGKGLAELATGGLAAAAAKAFADRGKSKDRGRGRSYSDSDDSRGGGRHRRSKSVSDYMRQGMGALGIGGDKNQRDDNRNRAISRGDHDDYSPPRPRGGGGEGGNSIEVYKGHNYSSDSSSDISSSEEEREKKTMGRKQLVTAGLASVATIHAAHQVYNSVEGRKKRHKELMKGEITPEEARKKKNKARLQDAASVGIAALGIKGAYSEWKEMKEQREEAHEFEVKSKARHERRLHRLEEAHQYGHDHGYGTQTPPRYMPDPNHLHPGAYQDQFRASAPDLPAGYYAEPAGSQVGGYYPAPPGSPGSGYYGSRASAHYSDGNPYHTGGVPPPAMGPGPRR